MKTDNVHFANSMFFGLGIGLIAPWIVLLAYYLLQFYYMKLGHFFYRMIVLDILTPALSLSVLVNLFVFYLFYYLKKDKASRGILAATFVYAFIVLGIKLIN